MPIIIRLDVDNPYPLEPFPSHIISKIRQDYYFPELDFLGYLSGLKELVAVLNKKKRRAKIFFRKCTYPSKEVISMLKNGRHEIGVHIENSKDFNSFKEEIEYFRNRLEFPISSCSKHGSGKWKGGRNHYPLYEADKYIQWAKTLGLRFFSGNGVIPDNRVCSSMPEDFEYILDAYWMESGFRDALKYNNDWLLNYARNSDVVVATHPEQWARNTIIKKEFFEILNFPESVFR